MKKECGVEGADDLHDPRAAHELVAEKKGGGVVESKTTGDHRLSSHCALQVEQATEVLLLLLLL